MKTVLSLCLVVLLAACGSGGGNDQSGSDQVFGWHLGTGTDDFYTVPVHVGEETYTCIVDSGTTGFLWASEQMCKDAGLTPNSCTVSAAGNTFCTCPGLTFGIDGDPAQTHDVRTWSPLGHSLESCLVGVESLRGSSLFTGRGWNLSVDSDGKYRVEVKIDGKPYSCFIDSASSGYLTISPEQCSGFGHKMHGCQNSIGSTMCKCDDVDVKVDTDPEQIRRVFTWDQLKYNSNTPCIVGIDALRGES